MKIAIFAISALIFVAHATVDGEKNGGSGMLFGECTQFGTTIKDITNSKYMSGTSSLCSAGTVQGDDAAAEYSRWVIQHFEDMENEVDDFDTKSGDFDDDVQTPTVLVATIGLENWMSDACDDTYHILATDSGCSAVSLLTETEAMALTDLTLIEWTITDASGVFTITSGNSACSTNNIL